MRIFPIVVSTMLAAGADWLTDGGDVVRNNWQRDEKIINTSNAKDIKLL